MNDRHTIDDGTTLSPCPRPDAYDLERLIEIKTRWPSITALMVNDSQARKVLFDWLEVQPPTQKLCR